MRLIDADALPKYTGYALSADEVAMAVENAPTIDAVPVVRCKDCKWWDKTDNGFGYCMAMKHGYMSENWEIGIYRTYKGDFYCADGERGDSDDE